MELARTARFWGCRPSDLVAGTVRDFRLDARLAERLQAEEAAQETDAGDDTTAAARVAPPRRPAGGVLPQEWAAPHLPI